MVVYGQQNLIGQEDFGEKRDREEREGGESDIIRILQPYSNIVMCVYLSNFSKRTHARAGKYRNFLISIYIIETNIFNRNVRSANPLQSYSRRK